MMSSLKKKPLPKLQFSQILALPKADGFMLNLNNSIKGEMDPYKFEELERYFVALVNRINGVEVEKPDPFGNTSYYSVAQTTPHVKVEPAFCTTVNKNLVFEVSKALLTIISSRNYREFRGYRWPFKIYGCGSGQNKYIPDIYVGSRNLHIYSLQSQGGVVYEVEIVVFYLLHFARLPIEKRMYFKEGSVFQMSTVKKTYKKLFDTYLNMFLPDALRNKKRGEGHRKSVPFIQVFGDLWFSPSFTDSPILHRIGLLPLMNALVRRVVITQAFYQWEWQIIGSQDTSFSRSDEPTPTCLSFESQSLQRPLLEFLFQAFTQWPLDRVQCVEAVVDMWLHFVTPWKVEKERQASMTSEEFQTVWGQWIAENLPFYSTLLKEFLRLSVNLDFRPLWARKMLNKVLTTFDDRLVALVQEYEQIFIESSCGYNDSHSEFWTLKVHRMLGDCYRPEQGEHGLAFHNPQPYDNTPQSFSSLGNRSMKSPKSTKSNCPCFKIATTLMNNLHEFQAQVNQPATGFSASLWTRIFGESSPVKPAIWGILGKPGQEYAKSIEHLVRLFDVEQRSCSARQPCSGHGLNYCEVDQNGCLTERGRQQLISGERIIDPHNLEYLKVMDVWEKPPMEFEIEFLLRLMRRLEFGLLDKLGRREEHGKKSHFLYGLGRRFASTSAVFWYCVSLCVFYYWYPTLFVLIVSLGSVFAVLTQIYPMDSLDKKLS